jgi:hypothetical protein
MNEKSSEGWLLHFREPSDEVFSKIRDIVLTLQVSPFVDTETRKRKDAIFEGELTGVVDKIESIVEQDYRTNMSEVGRSWDFDYVVMLDDRFIGSL